MNFKLIFLFTLVSLSCCQGDDLCKLNNPKYLAIIRILDKDGTEKIVEEVETTDGRWRISFDPKKNYDQVGIAHVGSTSSSGGDPNRQNKLGGAAIVNGGLATHGNRDKSGGAGNTDKNHKGGGMHSGVENHSMAEGKNPDGNLSDRINSGGNPSQGILRQDNADGRVTPDVGTTLKNGPSHSTTNTTTDKSIRNRANSGNAATGATGGAGSTSARKVNAGNNSSGHSSTNDRVTGSRTGKNDRTEKSPVAKMLEVTTKKPKVIKLPFIAATCATSKTFNNRSEKAEAKPFNDIRDGHKIITQEQESDAKGYHYRYETENGILAEETGKVINNVMEVVGYYEYISKDGIKYCVDYISTFHDGFIASAEHIPVPPPKRRN